MRADELSVKFLLRQGIKKSIVELTWSTIRDIFIHIGLGLNMHMLAK